jgi:hypothetical protein
MNREMNLRIALKAWNFSINKMVLSFSVWTHVSRIKNTSLWNFISAACHPPPLCTLLSFLANSKIVPVLN